MGKSNRIREKKAAAAKVPASVKRNNKKGMPEWVITMIAIVLAASVLLGVALSLLSSNGVFGRMNTVVRSENYKVNANVMSYFFYSTYNDFYSQYSSYISSMLDPSVSLKKQQYKAATATTPAMTWYDYFMNQTVETVKSLVFYCEEANALGLKLEEEDLNEIEAAIDSIESTATMYGYSTNAYISNMYGPGVQVSDVRKAMQMSALANKCMQHITDVLEGKITDERIDSTYAADKKLYNVVDYTYYTFSVKYNDVAKEVLGATYTAEQLKEKKDEVLKAYKEAIAEAKAKAEALKTDSSASEEDFLKAIVTITVEKEFDAAYGAKTIADADKPTAENLEIIKKAMIAELIAEVMEDKETPTDAAKDKKAYDVDVTDAYAKVLNEVKETVFSKAAAQKDSSTADKIAYSEANDFLKWAYAEERAAGETNLIHTGDGSKEDDKFDAPTTANITVYLLRKPQYADETRTRNVTYMIFASKTAAEKAIADLADKGTLTADIFKEFAEASTTASGHNSIEDYVLGSLGSDVFDEWLFDEKTLAGSATTEPLKLSDTTYLVAFYEGEGNLTWRVGVKNAILEADYDAEYERITKKFETTVHVQESLDNIVKA